jgi:hypothetical protein
MGFLYFERYRLQSEEYPEDVRARPAARPEAGSPTAIDAQCAAQLGHLGATSGEEREVGR